MSLKKSKELRFTYQDAQGRMRVVVVQVQHLQEESKDRVQVQITSDGDPVHVSTFVNPEAHKPVKTRSRL